MAVHVGIRGPAHLSRTAVASSGSQIAAPFAQINGPSDGPRAGYYNGNSADYAGTPSISSPVPFTVTRPGYTVGSDGLTPTTYDDTVYVVSRLRQTYPTSTSVPTAVATAHTVALSHNVYSGDVIYGGALQNSTLAYPQVVACWADVPGFVLGAGVALEVVAFNQFGQNSLPVATVTITGTPTTGSAVTKICTYAKSAKYGDSLPVWTATFADSDFPSNGTAAVSFSFTAYPWRGGSSAKRTTSGVWPDLTQCTPLPMYTGTPTIRYAVVDPAGAGATPQVSTTYATAYLATNRFADEVAAANALFTAQSDASFCVITFLAGSHTLATGTGLTPGTRTALKGWYLYRGDPADPDPRTNVQLTLSGQNRSWFTNSGGTTSYLAFQDMKITIPNGSFNLGNFGFHNVVWRNNVNLINNLSGSTAIWGGATLAYVTGGLASGSGSSNIGLNSTNVRFELVRGITATGNLAIANVLLSSNVAAYTIGDNSNLRRTNIIAHNMQVLSGSGVSDLTGYASSATDIGEIAEVQCIVAGNGGVGSPSGPSISILDHTTKQVSNVLFDYMTTANNTVGGSNDSARLNILCDPPAGTTLVGDIIPTTTNLAVKNSNCSRLAYKGDIFAGANDANTGAAFLHGCFAWDYSTHCRNNISEWSEDDNFVHSYFGVNSTAKQAITYTGRVAKNFKPTAGFATIPGAEQSLTWDINGVARRVDGTGASGAIES